MKNSERFGGENVQAEDIAHLRELCLAGVDYLCLTGGQAAQLFGISEATFSRHRKTFLFVRPDRIKIWEIAIIFSQIYRNTRRLFLVPRKGKFWHFTYSHELGDAPIDMLFKFETLLALNDYLEKRVAAKKVSKYETFNYS